MELTQQPCPHCSCPLVISWDMWGPFYVCPECGFSAEDDDELSQDFSGARLRGRLRPDIGEASQPWPFSTRK